MNDGVMTLTFISALLGGATLASSTRTSPGGIWFRHCSMILNFGKQVHLKCRQIWYLIMDD
ncbi:hypothetical protein E2C01_026870 [Portunus trituberculatus]|uniref:Uncharacterized protein n=1 Tax=Portunus trituberculatus TaxID=210409 RepID=A0A5B7EJU3_PORTR|nr:hypothetical protein [Portunus trituberculatus]